MTTSHSSRCRRRTFSSVSVTRGCFSEVCESLAGDGGRSEISTSPILLAARRSGAEAQPHTVSIFVTFPANPGRGKERGSLFSSAYGALLRRWRLNLLLTFLLRGAAPIQSESTNPTAANKSHKNNGIATLSCSLLTITTHTDDYGNDDDYSAMTIPS